MKASGKLKKTSLTVVVTRGDGTVDDYGEVMNSKWGPLKRWLARRRIERLNRQHELRLKEQ